MVHQNQNTGNGDKYQSLVYMLSGLLFVLVLLEKSMSSPKLNLPKMSSIPPIPIVQEDSIQSLSIKAKEKLGLKNIGNEEIPTIDRLPSEQFELSSSDSKLEKQALSEIDEYIPGEEVSNFDTPRESNANGHLNIYFIKFFGKDNKASTRLVRVPRFVPYGKDSVLFILDELKKGPRQEESSKGVLNSLPVNFTYNKNYIIKDGILFLDLGSEIEYGGGPQIIQDRLDQISQSLIGVGGIRGISITIDRKKVSALGGDGIPLPNILGKSDRKVTTL